MTRGVLTSLIIHTILLVLIIWGLPSWFERKRLEEPQAISVQLLDVADISNVPNRMPTPPKKEPVKEKPKPEKKDPVKPQPPVKKEQPAPAPKPEPVVVPEPPKVKPEEKKPEKKPDPPKEKKPEKKPEKKEEELDLDAILKSVKNTAQQTPDEPSNTTPSETQSKSDSAYIDSLPLTMSEKDAIRNQISKCWSPPMGAKDAQNLAAQLRVTYEQNGALINVYLAAGQQARYQSDNYFRSAVDSAMRAVRACTPLKGMPADKYQHWKDVELTFDPRDMLY